MPDSKQLSDAQKQQRSEARSAALVARRLKQVRRLDNELCEVLQKLLEEGVTPERSHCLLLSDKPQAVERTCSNAGTALRLCADAKRSIASKRDGRRQ